MTIADYQIGLSSETDNFNQRSDSRKASRRARLTPDEQEQLVWERRRRDWEKRQRGANRHHPARDREALSRLRSAVSSTDHAADIVQRLNDCVARKSRCRLWICSRCASERSRQQVERLVGNLTDHGHSNLAAFTLILGAIGLNGTASAEAAAAATRQEIERIRQHAKRSGVDIGYWGQVELKIVRTSELDETDHIATTLAEINPSSLEFSEILVPHVHGIARIGNATTGEVRHLFQKVFPASRQVVVKGLHDDQATDRALSVWGSYSTKSEIKTKRGERGKWFADMPSGQELMMVSVFQKALKYRGGRFSYHLQLHEVIGGDEFDERKYESWLFSRCLALRYGRRTFARDRLLNSYEAELASIHKRFLLERKLHYTIKQQGDDNDKDTERTSSSDGTRRSDLVDGAVSDEPISGREERHPQGCEQSDLLLPRPRAAVGPMAIRPHSRPLGYTAGVGHTSTHRVVSAGPAQPRGRRACDLSSATPGDVETDVRGGRMSDGCIGPAVASEHARVRRRPAERRCDVDRHGRGLRRRTTGPPD
jgi:hypothetical protein